ncbi:MAG: hypothetical protein ABIW76_19230, partial [Fibrobacteria bacterium]
SYAFGQYGIQIPLKVGAFLPGLPTTSLKQFMLTGMGEVGTTLLTRPEHIIGALEQGQHNLLMDFGLRLSANFKLFHQLPFTMFVQCFAPYNELKAENLFDLDYGRTAPKAIARTTGGDLIYETPSQNDERDRQAYMDQVKDPRWFVGFNLGLF